jgi:hypothetical protein
VTWPRPLARAISFWASELAGGASWKDVMRMRVVRGAARRTRQPEMFSLTEMVASLLPTCEMSIWYS